MRIDGDWSRCDDGVLRPVVRVEVLADDGSWKAAEFLLDIGADRTVFSAAVWQLLRLPLQPSEVKLAGVGGLADSVEFTCAVRLTTDQGGKVTLRGQYAGVMRLEDLDMSVLGRDITNLFSVIADHPGGVLCLLSQRHRYQILES